MKNKTAAPVDPKGNPIPLFHGTGNLASLVLEGFKAELTGLGNDQLGSGFYFTTDKTEASGYAHAVTPNVIEGSEKLGGSTSPGVFIAHVDIKNPIVITGSSLHDAPFELTKEHAFKILMQAPLIFDLDESPLSNWFEIHAGRPVTPAMIRKVSENYVGATLIALENDFFQGESAKFREALRAILGFDGVVHKFKNGTCHYVAWFQEQIISAFESHATTRATQSEAMPQSQPDSGSHHERQR